MFSRSLLAISLAGPLLAQDGGQLYTTYCSACHAPDGTGATGGTFPPLAGSQWVTGTPERAVKIVLHGLEGPISVLGKKYDLAMPPQGAVLPDDHIAAILTYIRTSWGNADSAITPEFVKSVRDGTSSRKTPFTAEEILKLHPLPLEVTALKNLTSTVYSGWWQDIPDFSKLKPESNEEEHAGIISVKQAGDKTDNFALVWEGSFEAPADGEYTFILDADDGARFIINKKTLAELTGVGPMDGSRDKQGKIKLTQGPHPIRVEYFELGGNEGIVLGWKGPGMKDWKWLSEDQAASGPKWPPIPLEPTNGRTAIYRNFIRGTTPRAIGFGFPGGVNLAYSADNLAPELLWTGPFMDAGHHWTDRGVGSEPPAGENVVTLSKVPALPEGAQFRGYKLDAAGNPTFSVQIGNQILLDSWKPGPTPPALVRTLTVTGSGNPVAILLGQNLRKNAGGLNWDDKLVIETGGAETSADKSGERLSITPGKPVTLTYRWK